MPINCQICQQSFDKIITSSHLSTHGISSSDYKAKYGKHSLASTEYRMQRSQERSGQNNPMYGKTHTDAVKNKISCNNKGRKAHNKGKKVTDEIELNKIRKIVKDREDRYKETGYHPRKGTILTVDTKKKISQGIKKYAANNRNELKTRAKKSVQTKIENNYDFSQSFRGRKHNDHSRSLIKVKSKKHWENKFITLVEKIKSKLETINIKVNSITNKTASLSCMTCNSEFNFTRQYFTPSKFRNDLCPVCRAPSTKSKDELEILNYLQENLETKIVSGNRQLIYPHEVDIWIPDKKIAIEYCGLYWHSELRGKDPNYHFNKYNKLKDQGIRLITLFEDEWLHKQEIVKSRLLSILHLNKIKYSARNCTVKNIDNNLARKFCNKNHIQGQGMAHHSFGLFDTNDNLISVMTFSKPNISKGQSIVEPNTWELNRFCSQQFTTVNGAAGKLFTHFVKQIKPSKIFSYSDIRWNTGLVYEKLGFKFISQTPPNYWYIDFSAIKRIHRFNLRKNPQDNQNISEWENRQIQGWDRIWDCGNTKWEWVNPTPI